MTEWCIECLSETIFWGSGCRFPTRFTPFSSPARRDSAPRTSEIRAPRRTPAERGNAACRIEYRHVSRCVWVGQQRPRRCGHRRTALLTTRYAIPRSYPHHKGMDNSVAVLKHHWECGHPARRCVSSRASLIVSKAPESNVSIAHQTRPFLKIRPVRISFAGLIAGPRQ